MGGSLTTKKFNKRCLTLSKAFEKTIVKNHTALLRLPFNAASKLCSIVSRASAARAISELIWVLNNSLLYHPTSGLMQILHFDWLRYQGSNSNSHRVAKFARFSLFFFFSPKNYFFNLHFLTLLLPFLSNQLGDTKTIRPFTLKGHGSIAHSASPHGLLTRSP